MQNISALFGPWIIGFYSLLFLFIALLYRAAPDEQRKMGGSALMAFFSIAGLLAVKLLGGGAQGGLVKVVEVLSRLLAVIAAINVAGVFGFAVVMPRTRARLSKFVEDLVLAGGYILAGLAVISASGADLSGILATSAVVTGVVAFSLQDTLGNIIGGMVLHLDNSFVPGDWIAAENFEGIVREIRWRQTTLETLDGDVVIIPNIILMKSPVTVMGRAEGGKRFRAVSFNVFYDTAPGEVCAAVDAVFREDPPANVAASPAPYCGLKDFQPNCAAYELRYYLSDLSAPGRTDSAVRAKIFYALSRAGIKLSVHNRSLVLSEAAQDAAGRGAQAEQERRLAALRGVEVFRDLNEEERRLLAGRLKPTPFAAGETITRQGASAHWLYILYAGSAEVRLYSGDGNYRAVKTLQAGDVLGEMGLLTGEPRTATVTALEEARCYRLDHDGFRGVLASRPEIAKSIAAMLARRKVELAAAREKLAGDASGAALKSEEQNLLSKIKDFFKL